MSDDLLEVTDEMRLVGVSEVECEAGEICDGAGGKPFGGFDQTIALDDPLRRNAYVVPEQSLHLTRCHCELVDDLIDPGDRAVISDARGDLSRQSDGVAFRRAE